jgi:PadR family transcriptional regulator, regulatory protein PadR
MAVLHLGDAAYGSALRDDIERRSGRQASRGAIHIPLERLEEKGLLASKLEGSRRALLHDARVARARRP